MKPDAVKQALHDTIQSMTDCKWLFSVRPGKDNTRNRKFPFHKVISSILVFRGGTLSRDIMDFFGLDPSIDTSSAFIQRREKILPEAFESLFQHFTAKVDEDSRYRGLRLLADRGYESYNNLAHIQEKGWFFLIRIKDNTSGITSGLDLPATMAYDVPFHLNLTRKQTSSTKQLCKDRNHYKFLPSNSHFDYLPLTSKRNDPAVFYTLHFRIVRFPISDTMCETIITNLDTDLFPLADIKRLYAMRWGIETSFRALKHTLGLNSLFQADFSIRFVVML